MSCDKNVSTILKSLWKLEVVKQTINWQMMVPSFPNNLVKTNQTIKSKENIGRKRVLQIDFENNINSKYKK